MSEYTYLVGLVVMGLLVFAVGMIAAERERRARMTPIVVRIKPVPTWTRTRRGDGTIELPVENVAG